MSVQEVFLRPSNEVISVPAVVTRPESVQVVTLMG